MKGSDPLAGVADRAFLPSRASSDCKFELRTYFPQYVFGEDKVSIDKVFFSVISVDQW
jgi:hypothetical protein